jgi:ribosome modulation factor
MFWYGLWQIHVHAPSRSICCICAGSQERMKWPNGWRNRVKSVLPLIR